MKILIWIAAVVVLLVLIPFVVAFVNLAFISQITQVKLKRSPEYILLDKRISVIEVHSDIPPSSKEIPDTGDVEAGREMLLHEDGLIEEGSRVFDDDRRKQVIVAFNEFRQESHVFLKNDVFQYTGERLGDKVGSFESPGFTFVDYVLPVNEYYFIAHGAMKDSSYPEQRSLWQVKYNGLSKLRLSDDPYYAFGRPPKIFVFADERVVVYYTGSYDFAYGGDASRPQFSVLRVYNPDHPDGYDMIKIGFKAGVVLDVRKQGDSYLLITDPSFPAMARKPRVAPRKWIINLN